MYRCGYGMPINLPRALSYYKQALAIDENNLWSTKMLIKLENTHLTRAKGWHEKALSYASQQDLLQLSEPNTVIKPSKQNYIRAWECYNTVLLHDGNHLEAIVALAIFSELGEGIIADAIKRHNRALQINRSQA